MGKRERYEPGTFSWVDLSTSDADGAKVFYGELFGWEFEDNEVPGGGVYTMCYVQGDAVAAIVQQNEQPGHWNSYVTVVSSDETAAKARQLGAKVFEEPFDVMEAGRMAVLADPSGAVLCVWQPRAHAGARRVNDIGCLTWNELQSRDPERRQPSTPGSALRVGDGAYGGRREAGLRNDQERRLGERRHHADDAAARLRTAPMAPLLHGPLV